MSAKVGSAQVMGFGLAQLATPAAPGNCAQAFATTHAVVGGAATDTLIAAAFPEAAKVLGAYFFQTAGPIIPDTIQLTDGAGVPLSPVWTLTVKQTAFAGDVALAAIAKAGTLQLAKSAAAVAGQLVILWAKSAASAPVDGALKAAQIDALTGFDHTKIMAALGNGATPCWISVHDTGAGGGAADDVLAFTANFPMKAQLLASIANVIAVGGAGSKVRVRTSTTGLGDDLTAAAHAGAAADQSVYLGNGKTVAAGSSVYVQRTTANTARAIVVCLWQPVP